MRREGRRTEPRAEDGACAQGTAQHPPGLEKKHENIKGSPSKFKQEPNRTEWICLMHPTSRTVSGVGIAVLQLGRPVWHQRRGRGVLRVWQGVAEDHRLPHLCTLDAGFRLPLAGHEALELLARSQDASHSSHREINCIVRLPFKQMPFIQHTTLPK